MTSARNQLFSLGNTPYYHGISRCIEYWMFRSSPAPIVLRRKADDGMAEGRLSTADPFFVVTDKVRWIPRRTP